VVPHFSPPFQRQNVPTGQTFNLVPGNQQKFQDPDSAFFAPTFDPEFDTVRTGFKVFNTPTEFSNPIFRAPRNLQFGFKPMTTLPPPPPPPPPPSVFFKVWIFFDFL
jgi:hypothetical protein